MGAVLRAAMAARDHRLVRASTRRGGGLTLTGVGVAESAEAVDGHPRGPLIDESRGRRCPALPAQAPLDESKRRRDVPTLWPGLLTQLHDDRPKRRQLDFTE
ncbi:hypothetical protein THAOC_11515 [Thalassiosira oceanica]|uniref:Uncharacterized protein n=1 Tax=Thalassiosira oceanica TaxID=159749 RepID=K0SQ25_THAOC|nr:hypothetical protein THAOC_11515 [Thalassiosira oceanica]|eukprot:EJK67445.1 hypothetical protein THAOC_11515 [Thalassiosira oceanica]